MSALAKALKNRTIESLEGLVHHSDQGVQYASKDYVDCLKAHNIQISMSRKGNPYDNAFAESFIKTLKVEEVYLNEYETFEDAFRNIWHFIEKVYNQKKPHSALDYRSPVQFEEVVALYCLTICLLSGVQSTKFSHYVKPGYSCGNLGRAGRRWMAWGELRN